MLEELITECWRAQPGKRPGFESICERLELARAAGAEEARGAAAANAGGQKSGATGGEAGGCGCTLQ